eukprot:15535436-Heterocapsa_arctica.AAC.1
MGCSECCLQNFGRLHGDGAHQHYRCNTGEDWCSSYAPHPGPEAPDRELQANPLGQPLQAPQAPG